MGHFQPFLSWKFQDTENSIVIISSRPSYKTGEKTLKNIAKQYDISSFTCFPQLTTNNICSKRVMYPSTIKVQKIGHDKFVSGTFNNKLIKFRIK